MKRTRKFLKKIEDGEEILDFKSEGVAKANRVHISIRGYELRKIHTFEPSQRSKCMLVSEVQRNYHRPSKPMEIQGVGASTLIDTAGFEDDELRHKECSARARFLDECDIYIYIERGEKTRDFSRL